MVDLSVKFCGVTFPNPLILPSGIVQEIKGHQLAIDGGAGGITLKTLTVEPREGYPIPRVIRYQCGILNAVGIRNPGLKKGKKLIEEFIKNSQVPVIASVFATNVKDFQILVSELVGVKPSLMELNLSCPHVSSEFGKALAVGPASAAAAVAAAKEVSRKIPILAKLTPNIPDIGEVAKACEAAGADGISAINTVGPGMVIDIDKKRPVLGNRRGGISGAGIKPIAIRCIYDIYESVKIPIVGMGGIYTWQDTVEMIMAGATLVGVGVVTYFKGYKVYGEIKAGLLDYMEKENIKDLKELIGTAHGE